MKRITKFSETSDRHLGSETKLPIFAGFVLGATLISLFRYSVLPFLAGDERKIVYLAYTVMGAMTALVWGKLYVEQTVASFRQRIEELETQTNSPAHNDKKKPFYTSFP